MAREGGRYEVVVDTVLELRQGREWPPVESVTRPTEPITIRFQDRTFTWHPGTRDRYPVVTVPTLDDGDWLAERLATRRFLSALSYATRTPIRLVTTGGSGFKKELDPPLLQQPRAGTYVETVGTELATLDDPELALCLALYREGVSSSSDALSFLSFWKVLEVAVGPKGCKNWIVQAVQTHRVQWGRDDPDLASLTPVAWWKRFKKTRNAAAHALPTRVKDMIDPDDPETGERLFGDARRMQTLARQVIGDRWPRVVRFR